MTSTLRILRLIPLLSVLLAYTLTGCGRPDDVRMEPQVYALEGLNSPYDDFNASAVPPPLKMDAWIVFASNAESEGSLFSLQTGRLRIEQDPYSLRQDKRPPAPAIIAERMGPFAYLPHSEHHVRGPTPLVSTAVPERPYTETFSHYTNITLLLDVEREPLPWAGAGHLDGGGVWMFDSDRDGRRNLYFLDESGQVRPFFGNDPQADDAYATYDFERHELLFSSNRSRRFQIYRYRNPSGNTNFAEWLDDPSRAGEVELAAEFQSEGDTLAPFVEADLLVFASNRPEGAGGYDLYAARYRDGAWEEPRNMQELMPEGVLLNTPANEFRPSLLTLSLKDYRELRVLLFSSDRPGGQGGYDLYLTALPDLE